MRTVNSSMRSYQDSLTGEIRWTYFPASPGLENGGDTDMWCLHLIISLQGWMDVMDQNNHSISFIFNFYNCLWITCNLERGCFNSLTANILLFIPDLYQNVKDNYTNLHRWWKIGNNYEWFWICWRHKTYLQIKLNNKRGIERDHLNSFTKVQIGLSSG